MLNEEDLDPDINYFNNLALANSSYVTCSELSCVNNYVNSCLDTFSLLHVNCRSLPRNFNCLVQLIDHASFNPTVIVVRETWTDKDNENSFLIPGYRFVVESRLSQQSGGLAVLVYLFVSEVDSLKFMKSNL
jgi:hypothetical protein